MFSTIFGCPVLNFNGSEIDVIRGYFRTTASFNGQQCNASIYVVDDGCEPVIGRDLLMQLGMTVEFGLQSVRRTESELAHIHQKSPTTDLNTPHATMKRV